MFVGLLAAVLQSAFALQSDLNRGMKYSSVKLSDYSWFIKLSR